MKKSSNPSARKLISPLKLWEKSYEIGYKMKNDSLVEKMVDVWLNERQVSKIYNVDIETLRRHRYSKPKRGFPYHVIGRKPGIHLGGYVRYNKYEIEKYLETVKYPKTSIKSISGDITSPKM